MDCTDDGDGRCGGGGGVDVVGYCRPTDCRDDSELYRRWRCEVGGRSGGGVDVVG